jgi:hypothetical protein
VLTANNYQPEWWNVHVIGVTNPTAYNQIVNSPNEYATAQQLAASKSGATAPVPTNIYLWFQVLPGAAVPSGAAATGGGSTAGLQHEVLFGLAGGLIAAGAAVFGYRRRYSNAA